MIFTRPDIVKCLVCKKVELNDRHRLTGVFRAHDKV